MDMGIVMDLEKASPRHFGGRAHKKYTRAEVRYDSSMEYNGGVFVRRHAPGGKTFKVTSWLQPALAWLQLT